MIKTLKFSGTILLHEYSHKANSPTEYCNKDSIHSLKLYIPIINEFMSLERLIIEVNADEHTDDSAINNLGLSGTPQQQFQERLSAFLTKDVRALHSGKTLKVYKIKKVAVEAVQEVVSDGFAIESVSMTEDRYLTKREEIDFAQLKIAWFMIRN